MKKMKKLAAVLLMAVTMITGNTTQAQVLDYSVPQSYQQVYYRTPYYNQYTTMDISKLLDKYAVGKLNKYNLIMQLMMQCNYCEFSYGGSEYDPSRLLLIECLNDDSYKYSIALKADGTLEVEFYDATYNGKDIHTYSVDSLINSEVKKSKASKRKYEIESGTNQYMRSASIVINDSRAIICDDIHDTSYKVDSVSLLLS